MELLVVKIPSDSEGSRLDRVLAQHPLIGSRTRAVLLIEKGLVTGGRGKIKASTLVEIGESYEIQLPDPEPVELQPLDLKLDIYFEDKDLLVLDKPAGLVVHPAAGHAQDTLVNALLAHSQDFAMGFGEVRPGIVHRLDKGTSGLLVVAKNDFTQAALVAQFKARHVHRRYKCIAYGTPKQNSGRLESFLIRHPVHRKKFCSEKLTAGQPPRGKQAITHYKTLAQNKNFSLLECRLETGRTHQIRIHLSENGLPLVGDELYGRSLRERKFPHSKLKQKIQELNRVALHAAELGFEHPRTKENLFFKAPWPPDLLPIMELLGWIHVD